MKMWPYNPGGRWREGHYKKGTTVCASSCRGYKVSTKFNMYTLHCVFIYYNTHDYISVRRVYKHVTVAWSYSLGQHFNVWKDAAETRDKLCQSKQHQWNGPETTDHMYRVLMELCVWGIHNIYSLQWYKTSCLGHTELHSAFLYSNTSHLHSYTRHITSQT